MEQIRTGTQLHNNSFVQCFAKIDFQAIIDNVCFFNTTLMERLCYLHKRRVCQQCRICRLLSGGSNVRGSTFVSRWFPNPRVLAHKNLISTGFRPLQNFQGLRWVILQTVLKDCALIILGSRTVMNYLTSWFMVVSTAVLTLEWYVKTSFKVNLFFTHEFLWRFCIAWNIEVQYLL